jgi:hypothetical protein
MCYFVRIVIDEVLDGGYILVGTSLRCEGTEVMGLFGYSWMCEWWALYVSQAETS